MRVAKAKKTATEHEGTGTEHEHTATERTGTEGQPMRVRVIFRGLVLFDVRRPDLIEAHLIGPQHPTGERGSASVSDTHSTEGHAGHAHRPEIQIAGSEVQEQGKVSAQTIASRALAHGRSVPTPILPKSVIEIVATGGQPVGQADSFIDHVPDLLEVMGLAASRAYRRQKRPNPTQRALRRSRWVHTTVTINRGTIRAKDVVTWDVGANGLTYADSPLGRRAAAPAEVKLLGSALQGHMASECLVDIEGVTNLAIREGRSSTGLRQLGQPDVNASEDMVEIIFTNYPNRSLRAVPWGMDFRWLYDAAGFTPADLSGREFTRFEQFARAYDNNAFQYDFDHLLDDGNGRPLGHPFPYVVSYSTLKPLSPLTDLWDRPLCVQGRFG